MKLSAILPAALSKKCMTEIYCIKINDSLTDKQITELRKIITVENNNRLDKFKFRADLLRTLFGELLVRYAVSEITDIDADKITIMRDSFNKPYFPDLPLYFNISHSEDYVICALSSNKIGIDIEKITETDIKIAEKFFSRTEYNFLSGLIQSDIKQKFFELWTIKESYVKFIGKGMYIPFDSFNVNLNDGSPKISDNTNIYFRQYEISGYKCTACSDVRDFPDSIKYVSEKDIANLFDSYSDTIEY